MAEVVDGFQTINLNANTELRFIINSSKETSIELLDGNAEIFGVEMIISKIYTFSSSFSVLTFRGCTLKFNRGNSFKIHSMSQSNVIHNIHAALEQYRAKAERLRKNGPITLIVGPQDVGKSTLTRSLLNHAARSGRKPLYVDLDVGQSSISIPGTMSILTIDKPEDLTSGFNEKYLSVYFFGYKSPGPNIPLYFLLINHLSKALRFRMKNSEGISHSGAIIDTCGWINGRGYQSIIIAAKSFQVDLIIVLSDKELHRKLESELPSKIEIQYIPKLKGVMERSRSVRMTRRDSLIREYFYGTNQVTLNPHMIHLKFSDIQILQVVCTDSKISMERLDSLRDCISIVPVSISPELRNSILAVSFADESEDVLLENVLGFIWVKNIDMDNGVLTVLSPQPSIAPKKLLIMGDIVFDPDKN